MLALAATAARADAIVKVQAMTASTIAEYYIDERGVRVEVEIAGNDLPAFRNLLPDGAYEKLGFEPRPLEERLPEFFARDLSIASSEGAPLAGGVSLIELRDRVRRDEITGEVLASDDDPEPVIFAELFFPFATRPDELILSGPSDPLAASIGFVAYHQRLAGQRLPLPRQGVRTGARLARSVVLAFSVPQPAACL